MLKDDKPAFPLVGSPRADGGYSSPLFCGNNFITQFVLLRTEDTKVNFPHAFAVGFVDSGISTLIHRKGPGLEITTLYTLDAKCGP